MRFLLPVILCLCLTPSAFASEVSELLKKMTDAEGQYNYQGVLVLRKANQLLAMQVEHGSDQRGVWESMMSLNGEPRQVVRVNDEITSIFPKRQFLTVSHNQNKHRLHPALPANLEAFYTIKRLRDDRIANHAAAVLDVIPNDEFRYGYRYWLDKNTGVLLRCDMINENQQVLEQMMFTMLEYLPEVPASAFSEINTEGYRQKQLEQTVESHSPKWQASNLPAGFMLTQSRMRKTPKGEVFHLAYSDGLASVSIFIEPELLTRHKHEGASMMGAMNVYRAHKQPHYVTVIGEVPPVTVKQIAQSVAEVTTKPAE